MKTMEQIKKDAERVLTEAKRIGYPVNSIFREMAGWDTMTAEMLLRDYKKAHNIF